MVTVGAVKELFPGEVRVAIVPETALYLKKKGFNIVLEKGYGEKSYIKDEQFKEKGVEIAETRGEVFEKSDIIVYVRGPGASEEVEKSDIHLLKEGKVILGFLDPIGNIDVMKRLAERNVTAFAFELVPRITRAQNIDALSTMASIAGYRAVVEAANLCGKIFPMLMTAAGTIRPAKVFVIGAGVAGLQAMAFSKKLGAIVEGYDIRPETKEQVQSVGARFVELGLETEEARAEGGYAKAMGEEFYKRQRELLKKHVGEADVVIATAMVLGKKAPILITADMVKEMSPGSVIVDLAAEKGGNCELTEPGKLVTFDGVKILGLVNPASIYPLHSSHLYSRNVANFLSLLISKDGNLIINFEDEVIRDSAVTHSGEIVSPVVKKTLSAS